MTSGDSMLAWPATSGEQPATGYARWDVRNSRPVLAFHDTNTEVAYFSEVLPRNYAGGGITVYVHWAAATATTGTVGWLVAIERVGTAQDTDADGFAADQTITAATTSGTSGIVTITNVAISNGANMDSLAAGEGFRLRLTRDVANDTVVGDAQVFWVEIKET